MKLLRIVGFVLVAVVVLAIAIPVLVLTLLGADDVQDYVTARVQEQTGRRLEFSGDIEIGFWPQLRLKTGAVTFANAPGFGDEPMFSVREFQIAIATAPLLFRREIALDTIRVHGARVNLERNAAGVSNFDDLLRGEGESEPMELGLAGMALGGIDIQDAALTFKDASPTAPRQLAIRDLNASTGAFVIGEPIDLKLALTGTATRPALDGDLALTGTIVYELDAQRYRVDGLELRGTLRGDNLPGGNAAIRAAAAVAGDLNAGTTAINDLVFSGLGTEANGRIELGGSGDAAGAVRGELKLTGSDLALLFRVAELAAADQLRRTRDRSFALATKFDLNPDQGTASVPEFALDLLGANLRGELTARNLNRDQPAVVGTVTATGPDLPAVLAVLGQFQSAPEKPLLKIAEGLAGLRDKSFEVAARFDTDLDAGRIDLSQLRARGLGYNLDGDLKAANINQASGAITGKLALRGDPAGPLLGVVANPGLGESIRTLRIDTELSGTTADLALSPLAINAAVGGPGDGAPVDLAISAGAARANLDRGDLSVDQLSIKGLGIDGNGNLRAGNLRTEPNFDGKLELRQFNLRDVLRRLRQELPETADPDAFSRVAFSTDFKGGNREFALNNVTLGLDDSKARGNLAIRGADTPAIEFAVEIDQLDADRYLPPKAERKGNAPPSPEAAAAAAMELPVELLRTLRAKGELRIAALRLSGLRMQNSRLALDAAGGELKLDPIATDLYQGSYVGRIQLNATGAVPRLEFQTELKDVNIEPLLADLNNASSRTVSGIAGFTAALGASGSDTARIRQNLSGQGTFAIRDGVYHGVNIPAVLSQTELMLKSRGFGAIRKEGDTAFESLGGTIQVNNGLMRSDDFLMRAPGFQAQGAGLLYDLNTGAIDYDLTVGVDPATATRDEERYDLGGYSIPINCRAAPPKSPSVSCLPDISRIAQAVGTRVITNQVQRLLQGRQQQPQATEQQQPEQPAAEEPKGNVGEQLLRRGLENLLKR